MKRQTAKDRTSHLNRALAAADWFTNQQLVFKKPWRGDQYRFCYYYFMPKKQYVPGLNWTHGRALFTLTQAYAITRERKYLDSAELGMRFVRALQPLDPYYAITHGSIAEEIPQAPRGGILDGAQAASGMLMMHRVTGEYDYLRRGRAFGEFLRRTWASDKGMPVMAEYYPAERVTYEESMGCIHQASAMPLWHLHVATGERQYLPIIIDSADRILACQRDDGGLNYIPGDVSQAPDPGFNHHWGLGEGLEKFLLRNDDGVVVVVLAAYRVTRNEKYLDALVRYAQWTMANEPHERPYNAFGIQAANVLDIGKEAGEDYSEWVLDHLKKHCLDLQVRGSGDPRADGGFRGEDEEGNTGIFGGHALDYVVTRTTCYMAGLLFRLSGKGTGSGFSADGIPFLTARKAEPRSFFEEQMGGHKGLEAK
ncbi:MAG: hypothetical protein ABIF71_03480 [Planctomycetota bacterium]